MNSLDEHGFRAFLGKRSLTKIAVTAHMSIVKEFEDYLKGKDSARLG